MTNLEHIKNAWAIGWSAVILLKEPFGRRHVVNIFEHLNSAIMLGDGTILQTADEFEIQGYLYAGELAGNDEIPIGTNFKIKYINEVLSYQGVCNKNDMWLGVNPSISIEKIDVEPYFND